MERVPWRSRPKLSDGEGEGSARRRPTQRRAAFRCQRARPSATQPRRTSSTAASKVQLQAELPFNLLHNRLVALSQWTLDGSPLLSSPFCLPLLHLLEPSFPPSHTDTHALSSVPGPSVGPPSLTTSTSLVSGRPGSQARLGALHNVQPTPFILLANQLSDGLDHLHSSPPPL